MTPLIAALGTLAWAAAVVTLCVAVGAYRAAMRKLHLLVAIQDERAQRPLCRQPALFHPGDQHNPAGMVLCSLTIGHKGRCLVDPADVEKAGYHVAPF